MEDLGLEGLERGARRANALDFRRQASIFGSSDSSIEAGYWGHVASDLWKMSGLIVTG